MTWKTVRKLSGAARREPTARIVPAGTRRTSQRLLFNAPAAEILPEGVVIIRNGDRYGLRLPRPQEVPAYIRKVSKTRSAAFMAWTGLGQNGQHFRVVKDGSKWLLEEVDA